MPSPETSRARPAASPTSTNRSPARERAAHAIRVPAKGRERQVGRQPPVAAQPGQEAGEPLADRETAERADADVQEIALGEVPAIAAEIRLGDELGRAVPGCQPAQ